MEENLIDELSHLVDDYLCFNSNIINYGFNRITSKELNCILHSLIPFSDRSPDMFSSALKGTIVLLEHFEFDASHLTRKGMSGKREERDLEKRIQKSPFQTFPTEWIVDKAEYDISLPDWQKNFETTFVQHYDKIDSYINNVRNHLNDHESQILIGFIVENQHPPLVTKNRKWIGELPYYSTQQFIDFFSHKKRVDFILFIGYLDGKPQVIYIDHESAQNQKDLADLKNGSIALSHLNKNEVTIHCEFEEEPDNE